MTEFVIHKTAIFKLRPTRRKAALLESVRSLAESYYWDELAKLETAARAAVLLPKKSDRRKMVSAAEAEVAKNATLVLPETVASCLARDVTATMSSFIELSINGRAPGWPTKSNQEIATWHDRLDAFAGSHEEDGETETRRAVLREAKTSTRPFGLARSRDCQIIRNKQGRIAVQLNILRASDPRSRPAVRHAGYDATTHEEVHTSTRKTWIIVPLECAKWHEHMFFSGKASLKSCRVAFDNGEWYLEAAFAFRVKARSLSGNRLGIDRGSVHPAAIGVVDRNGVVIELPGRRGDQIGQMIRQAERRRRAEQKRRGKSSIGHRLAVDQALHLLANEIVDKAVLYGAQVVVEKLDGLKQTMGTKRKRGKRRSTWPTALKKAQLGKLEALLRYKLPMAGLPAYVEVLAAGTSQTCIACGHRHPDNRLTQEWFCCVSCGFTLNADDNASIVIARRGVLMETLKKGDKLDNLHANMVSRFHARGDTGLGPLANTTGQRIVAVQDSAPSPYEPSPCGVGLNDENCDA